MDTKSQFGRSVIRILMISVAGLLIGSLPISFVRAQNMAKDDPSSFAVVELFTSEGYSSCPPADQLLGNIIEDARENNTPVFALAFHVDYWNDLGWKDIYSKPAYSQRQRKYARLLNTNIYTPQMIVNGQEVFVGSNRSKAKQYISHSVKRKSNQSLHLQAHLMSDKNKVDVAFDAAPQSTNKVINIAVVERGIVRHIKSGENGGRTLHHENVVRSFNTLSAKEHKSSLHIPDDTDLHRSSVIAYVQNSASGKITATEKVDL